MKCWDTVEFRRLNTSESSENTPPAAFSILRTKDINSIYMHAQRNSLRCPQSMMKAAIDSDYAKDFNPFLDCFEKMKKWDGKTDHIARLASLVKTSDPDFWLDALRHWLVGMVACALEDSVQKPTLPAALQQARQRQEFLYPQPATAPVAEICPQRHD